MFEKWRGLAAALLLGIVAAGCAQEGKLIDAPLSVRGVAYDQVADTTELGLRYRVFSTHFKVQVHGMNACEVTRTQLELSRVGPGGDPILVIRPMARYNTDDPCVNAGNAEGDTTLTLTVRNIKKFFGDAGDKYLVNNAEGPVFPLLVDTLWLAPPATVRFRVRVEDRVDASAVVGAMVALDSLSVSGGAVGPIGTAVTDTLGFATIDVATTVAEGVEAFRYQVTVTDGPNTQVLKVRDAPARGRSIERVFIRI